MIKAEDDATSIQDISNFTYNQFIDCLDFLEGLYTKRIGISCIERNDHLALVAAFALEDRLNEIIAEFECFTFFEDEYCDGGVSSMVPADARRRINAVVRSILLKFYGGALSNSVIASTALLRKAVLKRINADLLNPSCYIHAAKECLLDLYQ